MPDGTIEIITGRERRRRWSVAEKLRIVAESPEAGSRVAHVAARHGVSPSRVHGWRRQVREGRLCAAAIEVVLPSGGRILIRPDAPLPTLRTVIAALRG